MVGVVRIVVVWVRVARVRFARVRVVRVGVVRVEVFRIRAAEGGKLSGVEVIRQIGNYQISRVTHQSAANVVGYK